jgi:hypothetical protein
MVIAIYKILPLLPVLYVATNSQSAYACKQGGELEEDTEEWSLELRRRMRRGV